MTSTDNWNSRSWRYEILLIDEETRLGIKRMNQVQGWIYSIKNGMILYLHIN
jgi:hypothetical protein